MSRKGKTVLDSAVVQWMFVQWNEPLRYQFETGSRARPEAQARVPTMAS